MRIDWYMEENDTNPGDPLGRKTPLAVYPDTLCDNMLECVSLEGHSNLQPEYLSVCCRKTTKDFIEREYPHFYSYFKK